MTKKVSSDPTVPTPKTELPVNVPATKATVDGPVDPQAEAIIAQAAREATEATKQDAGNAGGVVPTGGIVRQLEDGAETDRRTGARAGRSLAGENLPVLKQNEPDPRQGVTTGDLTNPGVVDGEDAVAVTFKQQYHLYNRGERASFTRDEAQRLRDLGVAE